MIHTKRKLSPFVLVGILMVAALGSLKGNAIVIADKNDAGKLAGLASDSTLKSSVGKHHYPQNAELLKSIGTPDALSELSKEWWNNFVENETVGYPLEFKLLDAGSCVLRLAEDTSIILPNNTWALGEWQDKITTDARKERYGAVTVLSRRLTQQGHNHEVLLYLDLQHGHGHALAMTAWNVIFLLRNSTRVSTIHGLSPIAVRNASFIGNYVGEGAQLLSWSIGNMSGMLRAREEQRPDIVKNAALGEMASRLNLLFDPPPDDVADADSAGLEMNVDRIEDGLRIVATTPEAGPYHGWWLRLDTTEGEIEVKASGEAVIKDVPETGAKITVYAISPDGKIWHSASREIRAE